MDKETANRIYDILVQVCQAREDDRSRFIFYITEDDGRKEWRFSGNLGFGGKLYHTVGKPYVSCYPEDRTPERERIIAVANKMILEAVNSSSAARER